MSFKQLFSNLEKNLFFRNELLKDKDFLLSLYGSTREDELSMTTMTQVQKKDFISMQFELKEKDYKNKFSDSCFYIIKRKKQDIGRIVVDENDSYIHLVDIALVSKSRGKGFGSIILHYLISKAKEENKTFKLSVKIYNQKALKLYTSLGLNIVKSENLYHYMQI